MEISEQRDYTFQKLNMTYLGECMFHFTLPAGLFGDSSTVVSQNRDTLLSLPDITFIIVTDASVAFL